MLELLPLRLGGEGHAAPKDNINLPHLLISVRLFLALINLLGLLRHWRCWGVASSSDLGKFCTLLNRAHSAVNLTPLLCAIGTSKMPLLFLLRGLLTAESTVSSVPTITLVSCVDLMIILLS
jgi:hypothetical protein